MLPDEAHLSDPVRLAAWRKELLRRGGVVASALSQLLDGLEVDLLTLGPSGPPGDDPILRARALLSRIDRGIKSVGSRRFGRCAVCEAPLPAAALDEVPWLSRCAQHP